MIGKQWGPWLQLDCRTAGSQTGAVGRAGLAKGAGGGRGVTKAYKVSWVMGDTPSRVHSYSKMFLKPRRPLASYVQ